jgi:anaerobic selenocysteine-containing dehydrogenase
MHVPIRAGTDIAFLGGIINYILENGRYFEEYVKAYTNAPSSSTRTSPTPRTWTGSSPAGTRRPAPTTRVRGNTPG